MPLSAGAALKKSFSARMPPAEAPMPTTTKGFGPEPDDADFGEVWVPASAMDFSALGRPAGNACAPAESITESYRGAPCEGATMKRDLVVIGASAGGIDAMRALLA